MDVSAIGFLNEKHASCGNYHLQACHFHLVPGYIAVPIPVKEGKSSTRILWRREETLDTLQVHILCFLLFKRVKQTTSKLSEQ
jgi:hypothetical protein